MKKFLCSLLVLILCFSLVACSSTKNDSNKETEETAVYTLEGTYANANTHEGTDIIILITLKPDSTYLKTVVKDGMVSSSESGDYELVDEEVKLYDASAITYHGSATVYTFKDGNLHGPDTLYKKISEDN